MENEFVRSDWFKAIGGILFLIGALMPWWELEIENGQGLGISTNGFDYWLTGIVPFVIFTGIALLTIIIRTDSLPLPDWLVHPVIQLTLAVVGAVLVGIRFFYSGESDLDISRGLGLYLSAAAVVLVLIGCVLGVGEHAAGEDDEYGWATDDANDSGPARRRAGPPLP